MGVYCIHGCGNGYAIRKNKSMLKVLKAVAGFIYKYSGAEWVASEIQSAIFRYKLRVRMVPVSYKLFILVIGISIGGSGVFIHSEYPNMGADTIVIENTRPLIAEAKESPKIEKVDRVKELSELIYQRESTNGKNNYSKCEAIGKYNGVGYAIPGNGSYICFDSHEDEMQAVRGWIITKLAGGHSEKSLLCLYSGNNYKECSENKTESTSK